MFARKECERWHDNIAKAGTLETFLGDIILRKMINDTA